MQSSVVMAARSLVMIACLVAVPILAVFGTGWIHAPGSRAEASRNNPTNITVQMPQPSGAMHHPWPDVPAPSSSGPASAEAVANRPGAPNAVPSSMPAVAPAPVAEIPTLTAMVGLAEANTSAASQSITPTGPRSTEPTPPITSFTSAAPRVAQRGIPDRRRRASEPALPGATADPRSLSTAAEPSMMSIPASMAAADLAARQLLAPAPQAATFPGVTASPSGAGNAFASAPPAADVAANNPAGSDWFQATEQRLRQLGATHYRLEAWGEGGAWYRFHCELPAGPNGATTQPFEATDSSPERAVMSVASQIESWRRQRY